MLFHNIFADHSIILFEIGYELCPFVNTSCGFSYVCYANHILSNFFFGGLAQKIETFIGDLEKDYMVNTILLSLQQNITQP